MPRAIVVAALTRTSPPLLLPSTAPRLSGFGHWLRSQLEALQGEWRSASCVRLTFAASAIRLVCALPPHLPPFAAALAVARAVREESTWAARRAGWIARDGELWQVGGSQLWCLSGEGREPQQDYDFTRQSSTRAKTKKTMFIDQAASHAAMIALPPTAFMIWMPVR